MNIELTVRTKDNKATNNVSFTFPTDEATNKAFTEMVMKLVEKSQSAWTEHNNPAPVVEKDIDFNMDTIEIGSKGNSKYDISTSKEDERARLVAYKCDCGTNIFKKVKDGDIINCNRCGAIKHIDINRFIPLSAYCEHCNNKASMLIDSRYVEKPEKLRLKCFSCGESIKIKYSAKDDLFVGKHELIGG